ncbi:hypothetical protein PMAYCL1PPCAC_25158 [Pristionchus mayeri]|uniref:BTB domain-containing protein n=1 Tax=Pristionchus mayeri TaxID=1317129 RepID=A0AAN5D1S2_9BILA|nr:hypothetical protein PMAYCL1PPCAC_25158 [Pristionchus mayeri]
MDAKRRRLLSKSPSRSRESSAGGRSHSAGRDGAEPPPALDPATLPAIELFKADDLPAIEEAVNQLRKLLITRESISWFISLPDRLHSLLRLLQRASNGASAPDSGWSSILRTLVSLIGNMCNFSMRVCFELSQPRFRYATMATHLLESGARTCVQTKASVLRLTGNMCQKKESARSIASHGSLIDKAAALLEDDCESVRSHAFRLIRLLVERNFHRAVLLSNSGFYLGKLLQAVHADEKRAAPVISTLARLTRFSARDTGRQLSASECTSLLLSLFLSPSSSQPPKDLLLQLAAGSTDIRDRLGETDVIADLTKAGEGETDEEEKEGASPFQSEARRASERERCALLATFTQDAWGRAALRESGALDVLCARLAEATESTAERATILVSFRHLVHDTTSMAYLCRSRVFLDCVIKHVGEYVDCYGEECEPISLRDRDTSHRPWSPILVEPEQRQERRSRNEKRPLDGQALSLSYAAAPTTAPFSPSFSSSPSPPHSRSPLYSPHSPPFMSPLHLSSPDSRLSLSPPSSSRQTPDWSSTAASPCESLASRGRAESISGGGEEKEEEEEGTERERKMMKQVVDNELWLVGWQANEDANLPYLMREDLVKCLLSLLRMVSPHSTRLGRPLKRMADSRHSIEGLLSMHFHSRIFHALCTPPCRMTRFARRCKRCEQDAEFGSEILRAFSTSVDSDFGHGLLMLRLASDQRETRVAAALAKITLIRNRCRLSRRPSGEHSSLLQVLMDELRRILLERDYDTESRRSLYEGGPPTLVLIIGALSTLLDSTKIKDAFEIDATWKPPTIVECKVVKREKRRDEERDEEGEKELGEGGVEVNEEEDMVSFEDTQGNVLGEIALANLRKGSEYFNGMFSSDMVESRERRRKFVIDEVEEGCTTEEFRVFLHCLADCSPSVCLCNKVQRVETCMALIRLADKYLCSSLSAWILGPHGPVRRLLDGASLHHFLPLALQLYAHHKVLSACLVTLLRFSSDCCISQSMAAMAGEPTMVDEFVQKITQFIQNNSVIAV